MVRKTLLGTGIALVTSIGLIYAATKIDLVKRPVNNPEAKIYVNHDENGSLISRILVLDWHLPWLDFNGRYLSNKKDVALYLPKQIDTKKYHTHEMQVEAIRTGEIPVIEARIRPGFDERILESYSPNLNNLKGELADMTPEQERGIF